MQKKKTLFFQEIKMKKICKDLKKDETEIINYDDTMSIKNVIKSEIIVIILEKNKGAAHIICNLRCKKPKEILAVFHNDSTYDYHFIINRLAKEY